MSAVKPHKPLQKMAIMHITTNEDEMHKAIFPRQGDATRVLEILCASPFVDRVELFDKGTKTPWATGIGEHSRTFTPSMFPAARKA